MIELTDENAQEKGQITPEEIQAIVAKQLGEAVNPNFKVSAIVRKHLAEAKGQASDATDSDSTIERMAKELWLMGYPAFRDVFADRIMLPKGITTHVVPTPIKGTLESVEPSTATVAVLTNTYKDVVANKVRGVNFGWKRDYLETATWDAVANHLREAGRLIEEGVFKSAYAHLVLDVDGSNSITYPNAQAFGYTEFKSGVALVAGDDYECDVCLLHPTEYFELLDDEKFINAAYMGSADPIRTGKIRTTLGVTVFMTTLATEGVAVFFDSKKALCMAVIRNRKVEEYAYPDQDLYGIVATMKFGEEVILPKAIALLSEAGS